MEGHKLPGFLSSGSRPDWQSESVASVSCWCHCWKPWVVLTASVLRCPLSCGLPDPWHCGLGTLSSFHTWLQHVSCPQALPSAIASHLLPLWLWAELRASPRICILPALAWKSVMRPALSPPPCCPHAPLLCLRQMTAVSALLGFSLPAPWTDSPCCYHLSETL